jgi:hypothetical protein
MLETSQVRFIERGRVKIKNIHIPQIFLFRRENCWIYIGIKISYFEDII